MRALLLLGLMTLALGPPAYAQGKGESFVLAVPDGFKLANQSHNATMTVVQFLPEGQTPDNWSEMITLLSTKGKPPTIQAFVDDIIERYGKCASHEAIKNEEGQVNGYPFARWRLVCVDAPDTHKTETMYRS